MNSPQHNDCPINNKRILATCKHNPALNEKSITVDFDECNRNWKMYVGDYAVFGTDKCDFLFRLRIKSIK